MLIFILSHLFQITTSLDAKINCYPTLDQCDSLAIYFQLKYSIPVNAYIYLALPFTIYSETFTITSIDESSFPTIVLSGGPYFQVTTFMPFNVWFKAYLSLETISVPNLNIGAFQMQILSGTLKNPHILEHSQEIPLSFNLLSKSYVPTSITKLASVIPLVVGSDCVVSDWSRVIQKNRVRQLNNFILQLSDDVTTDRLDIELTLTAMPTEFIIHRKCYISGDQLKRSLTNCYLQQTGSVLLFKLRAEYPSLLVKLTAYNIEFYITHIGTTISSTTFTTQILFNNVVIDVCAASKSFIVDSTDYDHEIITGTSLYINTPNFDVPTLFSFTFTPRLLDYDTIIKIELGFILPLDVYQCMVFDIIDQISIPSFDFGQIYLDDSNNLILVSNLEQTNFQIKYYSLNCTGMIMQQNNKFIRISYQDFYQTIISKTEFPYPIGISSITQSSSNLVIQQKISLNSKRFNNPLSSTIITFNIVPTDYVKRVIVEFPYIYSYDIIRCQMNNTNINCLPDDLIKNRIILYVQQQETIKINSFFNITIFGMINPSVMPYNSKIYILLDNDNIMEPLKDYNNYQLNGVNQYDFIIDYIDNTLFQPLITNNFKFSQSMSRIYGTYLIGELTLPQNSVLNSNKLYLRIADTYQIYDVNCLLFKTGDSQKNNYISNCKTYQNYVEMQLITDEGNSKFTASYTLNISTFRTQDHQNTDIYYKYLPPLIQLSITDLLDNVILFTNQVSGSFNMRNNKIQLYWFTVSSDNIYTKLTVEEGSNNIPYYSIAYQHFKSERIFLGHNDYQARFNVSMNLIIPQIDGLIIHGSSSQLSKSTYSNEALTLPKYSITSITDENTFEQVIDQNITINPGDSGFWFMMSQSKYQSGQFMIQTNFSLIQPSRNSWNPVYYYNPYAEIPLLKIIVSEYTCSLIPENTEYELPLGGLTLPIIIDSSECIPIRDKPINIIIQNNNGLVLVPKQLSTSKARFEQLIRTSPNLPIFQYIFQITTSDVSTTGQSTTVTIGDIVITIKTIPLIEESPKTAPLTGIYNEASNILTLGLGCSEISEINLIIAIDEISDSNFAKIPNTIDIAFDSNYSLFKLTPRNQTIQQEGQYLSSLTLDTDHMIRNLYLSSIADFIANSSNPLLSTVNQSNLGDTTYQPLMTQVRNMQLAKSNLLDKSYKSQLQRYYIKLNQFSSRSFIIKNLEYNTRYSFAFFCRNLMNNVSEISQNFLFTSNETDKNNLTKGYLLNLTFTATPSFEQQNNILCSISQYFALNYYQVLSEGCNQCSLHNTTYPKINYTEYVTLNESFVAYENRTPAEQQRYLENLFVMKIYLNNYKQSSGISTNINATLLTKGTIDDDMMRAILNVTDDLYLQYLYVSFTYTALAPIKRGEVELAKQLVMSGITFKSENLIVDLQANSQILAFVGLHRIQPIFEDKIKHPTSLQLRRGLLGTMDPLSEGVQFSELTANSTNTLTFKNLVDGDNYILYWASSDIQNDCLSRQYSETGFQLFTYKTSTQNYGNMLVMIVLMVLL